MKRIQLLHWNDDEARERVRLLREQGYRVVRLGSPPDALRALRDRPPDLVVIDLDRVPSRGRDVGVDLRHRKSTRHIPILFAGGAPAKVERVRKVLPDAAFTTWGRIRSGLRAAERSASTLSTEELVVPESALAGYAGRPLVAKLGIRKGMTVGLVGAPEGFADQLVPLPEGARIRSPARGRCDLRIWFVATSRALEGKLESMRSRAREGPIWIAWRKKTAGGGDLTQPSVRRIAMAGGLVDYKICSVDRTWSALLFTLQQPRQQPRRPRSRSPG